MRNRTVLLVENEPVIAALTCIELESLGYEVSFARTGPEAIKHAAENRPEVILMDFHLDGDLDGADAADEIQNRFQIPVIFLTGCTDLNKVRKCLSTKPFGFVPKPSTAENLQKAIENVHFQRSLLERFHHTERFPYHDKLTGLPNRRFLIEQIRRELSSNHPFAVLYIDLCHFKRINNGLGYPSGDRLLQLFAAKLELCRRPGDHIARTESDEFVLLMTHVPNRNNAVAYADLLHSFMRNSFEFNEQEVFISLRIGISYSQSGYREPESMLNDAESAMHQSRETATKTAVFNEQIHSQNVEFFHVENDLRKAMTRKEFAVHYQPIVQLNPFKITGFEALLRWNHPEFGLIEAAEIIPIAGKTGLILPISAWVLEAACEQLAEWQSLDPELSIHVNLCAKHFMQPNLVSDIKRIIARTQIEPSRLKIEITENFVIDYTETVLSTMIELQSLNIGLQIDDFGKGYSSLSYLHQFPIDALKIDRSFIECLTGEPGSAEILEMIVGLGKKLHLKVIAEGVETGSQLMQIKQTGCGFVQGYFFSIPVDADKATQLLLGDSEKPFAA